MLLDYLHRVQCLPQAKALKHTIFRLNQIFDFEFKNFSVSFQRFTAGATIFHSLRWAFKSR